MPIYCYNTLTKKKEILKPLKTKRIIRMYVCGPTVYGPGHIGHARTYIAFDIIRRYLEYKKYRVKYIMNITDIHDDIIKEAKKRRISTSVLANKYTKIFLKEQEELGIKKADFYPRVTKHIKEIIKFIELLIEKGYAYLSQGSVYFDVSKFKDYGKLSGIKLKEELSGTRVKTDKYKKEEASDFALWKRAKAKEPSWQSPWGKGRPGWHIECSVLSQIYLGKQFEIHGGARDLIFPHHENEIAQSEAATSKKPFVKYWLHSGLLTISGQKMSKSLGNYIEISEAKKIYSPRIIRFFVAKSHYRSPLDWQKKNLEGARRAIERIDEFIEKLKTQEAGGKSKGQKSKLVRELVSKTKKDFERAMDDDFNTPRAISSIFRLITKTNQIIDKEGLTKKEAEKTLHLLEEFDGVFNFLFPWPQEKKAIPKKVRDLASLREKYRRQKKFKEADKIREEIKKLGFLVEDTKRGPKLKKTGLAKEI
jgi:cysteinyl-tRNA synthetase